MSLQSGQLYLLLALVSQLSCDPKEGLLVGYVILGKDFGVHWKFFSYNNIVLFCQGNRTLKLTWTSNVFMWHLHCQQMNSWKQLRRLEKHVPTLVQLRMQWTEHLSWCNHEKEVSLLLYPKIVHCSKRWLIVSESFVQNQVKKYCRGIHVLLQLFKLSCGRKSA